MPRYVLSYVGGEPPSTPEEGQKHFAQYQQWIADNRETMVSAMNPFKDTHTVAPDRSTSKGTATGMSGYTVIETDTMESALEIAKSCPFLDINGTLEVSELVSMEG